MLQTVLTERGNGDRSPEEYDIADQELAQLFAENAQLREALEEILALSIFSPRYQGIVRHTAEIALRPKGEGDE